MATAKITFYKCIQDSQDYGSDDEHMVSRVFFTFEVGDKKYDLYADIKQTVGANYEEGAIEVMRPAGYEGPFNYQVFRDAAEKYYRGLVGSSGTGINIQGGSNIRMRNNTFYRNMAVECEVGGSTTAW
ncbi:MAG: hypothetical protein Q7O12_12665 [Deltaproteobacteria bacterium]|nr:hypothetical protein [Deltaproteobacteria bacterium]